VRIWDVAKGIETFEIKDFPDSSFTANFSPDGKLIILTGSGGIIQVLDAASHKELNRVSVTSGNNSYTRLAAFSHSPFDAYSAGEARAVLSYHPRSHRRRAAIAVEVYAPDSACGTCGKPRQSLAKILIRP